MGVVVRNYQRIHEDRMEGSGPLPEDSRGRPLSVRAFVVEPSGLFRQQAPVAQVIRQKDSDADSSRRNNHHVVKYKYLKPDLIAAGMGAFPLLYPYGNVHTPYDISLYVDSQHASSNDGRRGAKAGEKCLTWAQQAKRRIYSDNILLNSGTLLQQWMLRTHKNIEDLRFR